MMAEEQERTGEAESTTGADNAAAPEAEAARETTEDWQALAEERWDSLLRLRADFENFRRRMDREREEFRSLVASELLARFLVVYDNLERALKAMPVDHEAASFRTGIEMTRRGFLEVLKQEGVETIPTVGQMFDPNVHEAIVRTPDPAPEDTVLEELQAGFKTSSRVIRAALVRVSAGSDADSGGDVGADTGAADESEAGGEPEQGGDGGGQA